MTEPDDFAEDFTEEFFDPAFFAELEGLAAMDKGGAPAPLALSSRLSETLDLFLKPSLDVPRLDEDRFVGLPSGELHERVDTLIEIVRRGGRRQAVQAVENFVVFFQALVPTLHGDGASDIKRFFFRLIPTLLHIAYNDFAESDEQRGEGSSALHNLETILIEISNVRLAPTERELIFRNIDQMAAFIAVGEYQMANDLISQQLLGIIRGNKLTRALFRLMEVEANVQVYLKEKAGYLTPQLRLPEDVDLLSDYGPVRLLEEEILGEPKLFIQVHIPEIPILRDIVLRLVEPESGRTHDLRFDALGSAELTVPPGTYSLGLVYQPE